MPAWTMPASPPAPGKLGTNEARRDQHDGKSRRRCRRPRLDRSFLLGAMILAAFQAADVGLAAPPGELDRKELVAELLFDGNTLDSSPRRVSCAVHGNLTFAAGRAGQCGVFDGQTWIDTGVSQSTLGEAFTVECWVNPAPTQAMYADLFGNHVGEGLGFVLQQDGLNTNEYQASYGAGTGRWVSADPLWLEAGRWQHVVLIQTRDSLKLLVNGVTVSERTGTTPASPSPLPIRIGLGYTDAARCFRGQIDSVRIWSAPRTEFPHAGIDAELARETAERYASSSVRTSLGAIVESWALATSDTRLSLGVTDRGELAITDLSSPTANHAWLRSPMACDLPRRATTERRSWVLDWKFVNAARDDRDGTSLTLRFTCADPALELESTWYANNGRGPIRHTGRIANRSNETIAMPDLPTWDVEVFGATAAWAFHSDGGTPDAVGVYSWPLQQEGEGRRISIRTAPSGEFIPLVVLEANGRHGVYAGLEWSTCRQELEVLAAGEAPCVRWRGGESNARRIELVPGGVWDLRPAFLGTYVGDLDDAGNSLRRWLFRHAIPAIVRDDPSYPKVQWNAFGATGKVPGSWDPVESRFYPLIDDIAPLGFEEVMIDVGWWHGDEPDSDPADWPSGMGQAAAYAHQQGLRFGLYWTDNLEMATAEGRRRRAERITRLFREYGADMWRSDMTRGDVLGASYAETHGFFAMVDELAAKIPNFQWENCSGGGRIKDYGALRRCVKIFNSDTYSALQVRQAFFDSSHALHPIQIEGHLGSVDGKYRPRGVAGVRAAFRSMSMGAPEWFLDAPNGGNGTDRWTDDEKQTLRECVQVYKDQLRPLVRSADLYHVLPRPDGIHPDGIEYYDAETGTGACIVFQPTAIREPFLLRLKGLDRSAAYAVTFHDGSHPPRTVRGDELIDSGLALKLDGVEASEWIFFERMKNAN